MALAQLVDRMWIIPAGKITVQTKVKFRSPEVGRDGNAWHVRLSGDVDYDVVNWGFYGR